VITASADNVGHSHQFESAQGDRAAEVVRATNATLRRRIDYRE
jgi:hypothetical protein